MWGCLGHSLDVASVSLIKRIVSVATSKHKGHIEKTSLTPGHWHTQWRRGAVCPLQCLFFTLSETHNRCGETRHRDPMWYEHFPSGRPLHRCIRGCWGGITSRFTYRFSTGLSEGISRIGSEPSERLVEQAVALPFFYGLTLNQAAPLKGWPVIMMACCVYWLPTPIAWPTI